MTGKKVCPGTEYRHYRGGLYVVICLANNEATGEIKVVYTDGSNTWERPLDEWFQFIKHEGCFKPRFKEVGEPRLTQKELDQ